MSSSNGNDKERIPLISTTTNPTSYSNTDETIPSIEKSIPLSTRHQIFLFLEARTPSGLIYESFTVFLILLNIVAFVIGTLFVEEYNGDAWYVNKCGSTCDGIWFGNSQDNFLGGLGLGTTSVVEIITVLVFTVDYLLRVWTADLEDECYAGFLGRIRYIPSFYSLVDLSSTIPFYVDALLPNTDVASSTFLRMFRLFRVLKVEGRYGAALCLFDDVFYEQRGILGTAAFVGATTWIAASSLYYIAERSNQDMIYCGDGYCDDDAVDKSLCVTDEWGVVDCTAAGCPPTELYPEPCYNLYRSIPLASYFALLNLFGEFPLIDQHGFWGKIVGTVVAVVAVMLFALPAGIVGNGFETILFRQREERLLAEQQKQAESGDDRHDMMDKSDSGSWCGQLYNFVHDDVVDHFINFLILSTTVTFLLSTTAYFLARDGILAAFDRFAFISVIVFTVEYILHLICIGEDPHYAKFSGRIRYMTSLLPMVHLLSFLPFWIAVWYTSSLPTATNLAFTYVLVSALRTCRILKFERYTRAFTTFDDVIRKYSDLLTITGFAALIMWIFLSAVLYLSERDNPNPDMQMYYKTVPHAMWMTLLNLSGESPLCFYSTLGKITTGIIGIFATGLFGIPIGILGFGFEEHIDENFEDTPDTPDDEGEAVLGREIIEQEQNGTSSEKATFEFVNGLSGPASIYVEIFIYIIICLTVIIGILQTVSGWEDLFHGFEIFAVGVFTVEYLVRLYGAPADPEFGSGRNCFSARISYIFSFYSIVDLLAILPLYITAIMPEDNWLDTYGDNLRMLRLLRLIKLDKYVPSITLIDDVVRLKRKSLAVTCYAAFTLWIIFSSILFLTEYRDTTDGIDDVPVYNCDEDCTMSDRFRSALDSMVYTCIHLTGDYPVVEYSLAGRFVCFFMVICAVGVVSVPSGIIASGFVQLVESRTKYKNNETTALDDDWYEVQLRELVRSDCGPPKSRFGSKVDDMQNAVNDFLNGKDNNGVTEWTCFSGTSRIFILTVIVLNVAAVVVESMPEVDRAVGNEPGNFFDVFEIFSVMVFALEYMLRLFSAPKNREALYSTGVYATTFFGIVDFLSTAPWFIEHGLIAVGLMVDSSNETRIFRVFRIFRILQLEDFVVAFSKLDNVFRASKDVLKAAALMATVIWVGCAALFYIFEAENPNFRECDDSIPLRGTLETPGCYDFSTVATCNEFYGENMCEQTTFMNMPDALFYVAVFLCGEWGLVDFTWPGRFVCLFLCVAGIGLYAIPVGTLFDSFGTVIGMAEEEEEEEEE